MDKYHTLMNEGYSETGEFSPKYNKYVEEPWTVIESYFRNKHLDRLVRHQLESYNHFVGYQIYKTIEMFNPVRICVEEDFHAPTQQYAFEMYVTFENFHIHRPQIHENNGAIKLMFPQEARLRNFTYTSTMTIDICIKYVIRSGDNLENTSVLHKTLPNIQIGKLPIMLKSNICVLSQYSHLNHQTTGECKYDAGGYFIINGSEKTVIGQERAAENKVYCFNISKNDTKYTWRAEIKSVPDFKCISPKQIHMMIQSKNNGFGNPIVVQIPRVKSPIPLFVLFRALNVLSDKDICEAILLNSDSTMLKCLQASIIDANNCMSCDDAIDYISKLVSYSPMSDYKKKSKFGGKVMDKKEDKKSEQKTKSNDKNAVENEMNTDGEDEEHADEEDTEEVKEEDAKEEDAKEEDAKEEDAKEEKKEAEGSTDIESDTDCNKEGETKIHLAKKKKFTLDVLQNDLFPHCKTLEQKKYFLGYMANKLLQTSLGIIKQDDRDSYVNKRIDMTGTSLNNLFRNHFNKLVKDMEKQIAKEIKNGSWRSTEEYLNIVNLTNIYKIVKSNTIENGLKKALSTGDFSIKHLNNNNSKVGVAQVLNRMTYIASLSHLRRVSTPVDKSGKLIPPRKLHNSSWGFICPAETPEGGSVGIVKNLSYMTHSTIYSDSSALYDYILPEIVEFSKVSSTFLNDKVKVFINGAWVGVTLNPVELFSKLKNMKLQGIINIYTSVVFDYRLQEIRVCNNSGRLTRPVLIVKNGNILITESMIMRLKNGSLSWDDLLTNCNIEHAVIEYIDPEEQSFSLIATSPKDLAEPNGCKYTHCEIHPSTIFGVVASCIPYPDHNQSPRNTYQCAQAKQAMGVYTTNFHQRMDKTAFVLTYPTRPLVDTRVMNIIKLHENPSGCNINVAIMTHTGYNQEDSLLVNKGSIDRGLLQITLMHTEKDEDKQKTNGDEEIRCKPDRTKTKGMKFGNYDKVNSKGIIPENTFVENRDMIITKVTPIKENKNDDTKVIKYEDCSKQYKTTEETFVDRNYMDRNGDGYNFAKVRLRTVRKPVIGDKFSSRHGQKGTVGNIIPEEDMPFTKNGERPDIIINPHAIPSRMTIGQLKETLLGKVLVQLGLFGDGTSFGDLSVESISDKLLELGYESSGEELLYNGLTGKQIECSVFMGPVFYQRLKHMVNDKQHSRSNGPMVNLTRQPAEGRCREGGLRIGEMERDCMVSHGAARFTRSRMYDVSDKFSVFTCKRCGLIASVNPTLNIHNCHTCGNNVDFAYVELPYACKLLFQELTTMNVIPRVITE